MILLIATKESITSQCRHVSPTEYFVDHYNCNRLCHYLRTKDPDASNCWNHEDCNEITIIIAQNDFFETATFSLYSRVLKLPTLLGTSITFRDKLGGGASRLCNSSDCPKKIMEEDNTELSLKLRCADETVSFINPYMQARRFPDRTLSRAAEHIAQDMVSNNGEIQKFNPSSRCLIPASCAFVKKEILDMDAVSCRAPREESEDMIIPGTPRKKLRLSKDQSSLLEESFREHSALSPKHKSALASKLNLQPRQVEVWFQNRRARTKLKRKEVECDNLKRCCESLREENRRLEREVQALRAMKIVQGTGDEDLCAQSPLAAATLTMCPSCERLATNNTTSAITSQQIKTNPPRLISQFPYNQSAVC